MHQKSVIFVIFECNWDFFNYSFKFQPNVCNRYYDLLMMSINLSDIAFLNIIGSDYRCFTSLISKNEAIKLMQNADLTEKSRTLLNIKMHKKMWILSDLLRNF